MAFAFRSSPAASKTAPTGKIISMAMGGSACVIYDTGQGKCWGSGLAGLLLSGSTANLGDTSDERLDKLPMTNFGTGLYVKEIVTKKYHMCALFTNGKIKCWGTGAYGRLGYGSTANLGDSSSEVGDNLAFVDLGTNKRAISVGVGQTFSCALLDDGTVKCWGDNQYGQLGQGDTTNRGSSAGQMGDSLPTINIGTGLSVRKLAVGDYHVCVLITNGTVKCWGYNSAGQLGLGDGNNRGDNASEMGDSLPTVSLGTGRTATNIYTGGGETCATLDNNTLKCWGNNSNGQLGLGDTTSRGLLAAQMGDNLPVVDLGTNRYPLSISLGDTHACALLDNATVKCWGEFTNGRLGGVSANLGDNSGEMGDSLVAVNLGTGRTARAIFAGLANSCAVLDDYSVKCWGVNNSGQLGQGDTTTRGLSAATMGDNLLALKPGKTKATVSNMQNQVPAYAVEDSPVNRYQAILASGSKHNCILLSSSSVKCWGDNTSGQLGIGSTTNKGKAVGEMGDSLSAISFGGDVIQGVYAGANNSCVITSTGSVKCWGDNTYGQLGLDDTTNRGDGVGAAVSSLSAINLGTNRTARKLAIGNGFICALLDNNSVKCWGNNSSGQLGQGDTTNRGNGVGASVSATTVINLGTSHTAIDIAAQGYATHACAILDNGGVKCWGDNSFGQLGQGDTTNRGDGVGASVSSTAVVNLGTNHYALKVAVGGQHTCALLEDYSVKCWGKGGNGRLGNGTANLGDGAGEMGDSLAVTNLGTNIKALSVYAGYQHTCVLTSQYQMKCFGDNTYGQLGYGDTTARGDVAGTQGDNLSVISIGSVVTSVKGLSLGSNHTCAILADSEVKCWGGNGSGQLGLGNTSAQGDGANEMGNYLRSLRFGK